MSRIIKFRFRYTDGENWILRVFNLREILNGEPFEVLSDSPLLKKYKHVGQDEWTGLKDKNGVEVFEGDIIKHGDDVCPVYYDFGQFQVRYESLRSLCKFNPDCYCDIEVIGNIYENPELLKGGE